MVAKSFEIMEGVTEYVEGRPVKLSQSSSGIVISAENEAGYNGTEVDLGQLLKWVSMHLPTVYNKYRE